MTPERYKKIARIFDAALKATPEERIEFLAEACAGDDSLRQEVELLIASHERAGEFIDEPAYQAAAEMLVTRDHPFKAGQMIAHYVIRTLLGQGGMGKIYLAEDTKLQRNVALKVLALFERDDREARKRLLREARAAASLDHPNICAIYEVGEQPDRGYIAMQYVEGETLAERLGRQRMPLEEGLRIATQVAAALSAAHEHNIIHRDIKPANLMITTRGDVKVLDFGLAKVVPPSGQPADPTRSLLTQPGSIVGTVPYMSPEQLRGERVDARTDIFSFGATLYEMLNGKPPFVRHSVPETMAAILEHEPEPLTVADFEPIVRKCLAKDKRKRYQTANELLTELQDLRRRLEDSSTPEPRIESMSRAAVPPRVNLVTGMVARWKIVLFGVIAILGLALGLYVYATRDRRPIDSLAVLPFQNDTGDPNTDYLSDGISEALINSLTELHQLRVIARTTTFRYKGKDIDPLQIGRDLNVRSVLTGSVRQTGDNLVIQVDLVDAATGRELWGHGYERKASDLLSIKQAIAREVSDTLRLRLSGDEQKQLTKRDTTSGESFQFYLRGRYYWNKRTTDSLKKAVEEFQEAIDRDPGFALGYVGLADAYVNQEHYSGMSSRETLPKAREAVDRALAIDNSLAEAHTTSAAIYQREWRWAETEDELKRAITLNPNYPTAHHFYAYYLYVKRQFDAAAREINRAHELDPLSPVISENLSMVQLLRGDVDAAIEQGEKTIALDPKFADAHYVLAFAYLRRGREQEATAEFQKAVELSNRAGTYLGNLGYCYALAGKRAEALAIAKELAEKFSHDESSGLFVAAVYAGLGDKDQAFAWLNKDFQQHSGQLPTLTWRPLFESLRSDPRYTELVRSMGL
jgi:serine/threonine protein kinase/Tfp pilus assembly protein PilF